VTLAIDLSVFIPSTLLFRTPPKPKNFFSNRLNQQIPCRIAKVLLVI
jgi:hypothetical protein